MVERELVAEINAITAANKATKADMYKLVAACAQVFKANDAYLKSFVSVEPAHDPLTIAVADLKAAVIDAVGSWE